MNFFFLACNLFAYYMSRHGRLCWRKFVMVSLETDMSLHFRNLSSADTFAF